MEKHIPITDHESEAAGLHDRPGQDKEEEIDTLVEKPLHTNKRHPRIDGVKRPKRVRSKQWHLPCLLLVAVAAITTILYLQQDNQQTVTEIPKEQPLQVEDTPPPEQPSNESTFIAENGQNQFQEIDLERKQQLSELQILSLRLKQYKAATQQKELQLTERVEQLQKELAASSQQQDPQFAITPIFWTFDKENPSYLDTLMMDNQKRQAKLSNFSVNVLTLDSYASHLSEQSSTRLQKFFSMMKQRVETEPSNLKTHFERIQRRLVLLTLLYEYGGVAVDDLFTLTQNFDWIRHIRTNPYVNRGNPGHPPKVVGFYSPFYSSSPQKAKKILTPGMQQVEKYMVILPTIQTYFIAAQKHSQFIGRLLQQIMNILTSPTSVNEDIASKKYKYIMTDGKDVYYQYAILACQRVLAQKQKQLDKAAEGQATQEFAVDYYGLNLINCFYGPYKISVFFEYVKVAKRLQNIAALDLQQYEASVGPMRYLEFTTIPWELKDFLTKLRKAENGPNLKGVMKGSFLQKMYFPDANETFIYQNPEKPLTNSTALPWTDLPKILWFYWDSGLSNTHTLHAQVFLCLQNLKRMCLLSGYQFREVNSSNLKDHLDAPTIERIEHVLQNGKMLRFLQTRSDLYRLALLHAHGGVYIDASTIITDNFSWIENIARFPSQFIFNRYGQLPHALILWNQNFGGLYDWQVNPQANTKAQWHLSYLNGFIAASKGSEFILEWMNLFLQSLMLPVEEVLANFEKCHITEYKWTSEKNHYLLGMDVAKCVLGRREDWLKNQTAQIYTDSMDYYKLWTISSFLGLFKLRYYTNYDNNNRKGEHYYLTRYSQDYAEGVIGKIHFFIKIIGQERPSVAKFLIDYSGRLTEATHSRSVFRKYLYSPKHTRFQIVDEHVVVKFD